MKIKQITETTAGATSSGSVASVAKPMGKMQKRNSIFKGKKTNKPFYEAEINEADFILVPGQIKKKDKSFIPHKEDRRDHEVEMARSDLYAAAKNAMRIYKLLANRTEDQGLMGWQQSYITLAADYLNSVADNIEYEAQMNEMTGGVLAGGMSNFEEGNSGGYDKATVLLDKFLQLRVKAKMAADRGRFKEFEMYNKSMEDIENQLLALPKGKMHLDNMFKQLGTDISESKCPHCGGEMVSEELMNEKKDACYHKVKSRYKVWPSAYASGALVKCRKKGASNWGKKSESVEESKLAEKWSKKYKDSINCSNPKGFSQKAHCAGKKK